MKSSKKNVNGRAGTAGSTTRKRPSGEQMWLNLFDHILECAPKNLELQQLPKKLVERLRNLGVEIWQKRHSAQTTTVF